MLTSKQRAYLRSVAAEQNAIMQIGKSGITPNLIKTVSDALEAKELIKLSVLETCEETSKSASEKLCAELNAEGVAVVGRKFVIYRESKENKRIILPDWVGI